VILNLYNLDKKLFEVENISRNSSQGILNLYNLDKKLFEIDNVLKEVDNYFRFPSIYQWSAK
jgi:chaperonin cofactor prefoldin